MLTTNNQTNVGMGTNGTSQSIADKLTAAILGKDDSACYSDQEQLYAVEYAKELRAEGMDMTLYKERILAATKPMVNFVEEDYLSKQSPDELRVIGRYLLDVRKLIRGASMTGGAKEVLVDHRELMELRKEKARFDWYLNADCDTLNDLPAHDRDSIDKAMQGDADERHKTLVRALKACELVLSGIDGSRVAHDSALSKARAALSADESIAHDAG